MADVVLRKAGGDARCAGGAQAQVREQKQERRPVQERLQGQARPQPQQRSCNRGPVQERNRRRVIFHSDMNAFYASAEQAERPELRGVPLVVGGHEERRHGIVLAKSAQAKAAGIVTGEALWSAREKCPGLVVVPPRYDVYQKYSRLARRIYYQYTDLVEPFGLDEAWLDLTGALALSSRSALDVAREISQRVKDELGCTVSIGVSWNKIFAKFGSDLREAGRHHGRHAGELPRPRVAGPRRRASVRGRRHVRQAALVGHRHRRRLGLRLARAAASAAGEGGLASCARSRAARTRPR